jgi:hypothetical protein
MLLFKYFIARNFVFLGTTFSDCSLFNAGGKVGLLATVMTLGSTVCVLLSKQFLKNIFADCLLRFLLNIQSKVLPYL